MKRNTFKLLFITCLLFIGNMAYADDAAVKSGNESTETAKTPDTNTDKAADTGSSAAKDEPKVHVKKLNSGVSTRAVGGLAKHRSAGSNAGSSPDKKRIEELEDLVQEQKKLLEMYKKQLELKNNGK